MRAKQIILSRGLPKTGQITEYLAGDDGTHEAGWWLGRLIANNKTRYITKTINGDDVIIDRVTGLMWAANGNAAGCDSGYKEDFADRINYANSLTFAGYTDWRVPNILELISLIDYNKIGTMIDAGFFPNTLNLSYWSSTTYKETDTEAFTVDFSAGDITLLAKNTTNYLRCVRLGV